MNAIGVQSKYLECTPKTLSVMIKGDYFHNDSFPVRQSRERHLQTWGRERSMGGGGEMTWEESCRRWGGEENCQLIQFCECLKWNLYLLCIVANKSCTLLKRSVSRRKKIGTVFCQKMCCCKHRRRWNCLKCERSSAKSSDFFNYPPLDVKRVRLVRLFLLKNQEETKI